MTLIRRARLAAHALIATALASLLVASPGSVATTAEAISATAFNPGMIITDARFYNGNAMTAAEIQSFLNAKVPVCKDGDLTNDITCLKDYRADTYAIAADSNCAAVAAGSKRTAAQIIDMVARACGVSQKVLLVTLQKEQGLVTHTDPGARRYEIAMGYACPDTAPCDPTKGGFFRQVYLAAWQFKQYAAKPANYGYRAGQWNSIGYNPDAACDRADVYIQNKATAGLYNYTPYVPNSRALSAGYGTGDACSSYGNRNFFLFYGDWFGDPTSPEYTVNGGIRAAWTARGGITGPGNPTGPEISVSANGGGWYQAFERGVIYYTKSGIDTYMPTGSAFASAYQQAGGPAGAWGWPITEQTLWNGLDMIEFRNVRVVMIDGTVTVGYPFADVSDNTASRSFNGLAASTWWMASEGISTGWAGALGPEYRPLERSGRYALAAFLYRWAQPADFVAPATPSFVDVAPTYTFYKEIEWLATTGIAKGWTTSSGAEFRAEATITREQMAAFLYRMAAPEGYVAPESSPFVDVSRTSTPFYTEICWLAAQGISTGWPTAKGTEFRPAEPVLRDQIAAFLQRFDAVAAG